MSNSRKKYNKKGTYLVIKIDGVRVRKDSAGGTLSLKIKCILIFN